MLCLWHDDPYGDEPLANYDKSLFIQMEMSGSFAQKYYKDENKDMFKSLTEKRDDNRSNGCGDKIKLITCRNFWFSESIRPTVNRNKPKPDHFKLDKTPSRCLIELNIY